MVTIHPGVVFYCNVCYLVEKCRCGKEDSAGALVWFSATLLCILDSWGQYPKSIDTMPNEDEELPGYHAAADRPSCSNAWYTVESVDKLMKLHETLSKPFVVHYGFTRYWSERAYHQKHGVCGALHPRLALRQWTSDIGFRSLRCKVML